jgi:hypothetical protein
VLAICALVFVQANAMAAAQAAAATKIIVGYQGWFGCPGDFEDNPHWQHWFVKAVKEEYLTVDMLPDLSELDPKDQCDTGLPRADGQGNIKLFSSLNPNVVDMHFRWMAQAGIEAVALQRFVGALSKPVSKRRIDRVLQLVQISAKKYGLKFYLTYDVSGADPLTVVNSIQSDWAQLIQAGLLHQRSAYLHLRGLPVVQLWGFGFSDRPGGHDEVLALIKSLKTADHPSRPRAYVIGGVPTGWRTRTGDARPEAAWHDVYAAYDALSPWNVGRYASVEQFTRFDAEVLQADRVLAAQRRQDYVPVVFPGFSWANLMRIRSQATKSIPNQIPRSCGLFLRTQMQMAKRNQAQWVYAAMFDELDEATAVMPVLTDRQKADRFGYTLATNHDGCDLPSHWYLDMLKSGR